MSSVEDGKEGDGEGEEREAGEGGEGGSGAAGFIPRAARRLGLSIFCHSTPRQGKPVYLPFRRKSSRKWSRTTTAGMIQPICHFFAGEGGGESFGSEIRGGSEREKARARKNDKKNERKKLTPSASPDPAIDWNATPTHSPRPLKTGPPEFPDCVFYFCRSWSILKKRVSFFNQKPRPRKQK